MEDDDASTSASAMDATVARGRRGGGWTEGMRRERGDDGERGGGGGEAKAKAKAKVVKAASGRRFVPNVAYAKAMEAAFVSTAASRRAEEATAEATWQLRVEHFRREERRRREARMRGTFEDRQAYPGFGSRFRRSKDTFVCSRQPHVVQGQGASASTSRAARPADATRGGEQGGGKKRKVAVKPAVVDGEVDVRTECVLDEDVARMPNEALRVASTSTVSRPADPTLQEVLKENDARASNRTPIPRILMKAPAEKKQDTTNVKIARCRKLVSDAVASQRRPLKGTAPEFQFTTSPQRRKQQSLARVRRGSDSGRKNRMVAPSELAGGRNEVSQVFKTQSFVDFDMTAGQIYEMSTSAMTFEDFITWLTCSAPIYAPWVPDSIKKLVSTDTNASCEFVLEDGKYKSPLTTAESDVASIYENAIHEAAISLESSNEELARALDSVRGERSSSTRRRIVTARAVYCYALTLPDGWVLVYVGESVDVEARINAHLRYLHNDAHPAQEGHKMARSRIDASCAAMSEVTIRAWCVSTHDKESLTLLAESYLEARARSELEEKCTILELASVIGCSGFWSEAYYTARLGSLSSASTGMVLGMNMSQPGIPYGNRMYKTVTPSGKAAAAFNRCMSLVLGRSELLEEFERRVHAGEDRDKASARVWMAYARKFWTVLDEFPASEHRLGQTMQVLSTERACAQSIAFTGVHHAKSTVATMKVAVHGEFTTEHFVFEGTVAKVAGGMCVSFDNRKARDELARFVEHVVVKQVAADCLLDEAIKLKARAKGSSRFTVTDPLRLMNHVSAQDPAVHYDPRKTIGNVLYMGSIGPEPAFEVDIQYKHPEKERAKLASFLSFDD